MRYLKSDRLYCFSPPVMIATCAIEVVGALWTIWRYKLDKVSRLAVAVLFFLAVFQLAEYNICEGAFGLSSLGWARAGFVAITFLPPFGIHLAYNIAHQKSRWASGIVAASYVAAVAFTVYFLTAPGFDQGKCMGNYVIFALSSQVTILYSLYYYGLLAASVAMSLLLAARVSRRPIKKSLHALAMGYIAFVVPTTAANLVAPATLAAIPSVMCGFAVILAIILVGFVVPAYYEGLRHGTTKTTE